MATQFDKATITAVLALAAMLAGCAHDSIRSERDNGAAGAAVRATLAAQVINPAAGLNPNPVAGMDGNSARSAVQRYEQGPNAPVAGAPLVSIVTK
ncbi:MAG: hypothetical protein JWQ01_1353 [Massilia sp.]|jgi:type IV pilus biogenesis protein CpaD/CtpE|nr:hypothetical protein [Massilia sp.]